jgi:hypothetical protein
VINLPVGPADASLSAIPSIWAARDRAQPDSRTAPFAKHGLPDEKKKPDARHRSPKVATHGGSERNGGTDANGRKPNGHPAAGVTLESSQAKAMAGRGRL